jgi:hypothetical protein
MGYETDLPSAYSKGFIITVYKDNIAYLSHYEYFDNAESVKLIVSAWGVIKAQEQ